MCKVFVFGYEEGASLPQYPVLVFAATLREAWKALAKKKACPITMLRMLGVKLLRTLEIPGLKQERIFPTPNPILVLLRALLGLIGFFVFLVITVVMAAAEVWILLPILLANKYLRGDFLEPWFLTKASFKFSNRLYDWSGLPD